MRARDLTTETDRQLAHPSKVVHTLKLLFSAQEQERAERFIVTPGGRVLGREPGLAPHESVCLETDTLASRRHARVWAGVDAVELEDLGSKNGTFVNGSQVNRHRLQDGDLVRIGGTLLLLRVETECEPAAGRVPFVAESNAMRILLQEVALLAPQAQTILVVGETGSGKELIARHIHMQSRRAGPLVAVNCAAIPSELAESILFGHKRGAFSGATHEQEGFFRAARDGTLFLDEVGELPLALQAKLLRALELREVTPVGSTASVSFQARIVAATNRDLRRAVLGEHFRSDLFARLCGVVIEVPPLRRRREDILGILRSTLSPNMRISTRLAEALLLHAWPLNVRELVTLGEYLRIRFPTLDVLDLEHAQGRLQMTSDSDVVSAAPFLSGPPTRISSDEPAVVPTSGREPDHSQLVQLLTEYQGNLARVATAIGRSPRQVRRRMEQLGLHRKGFLPER